MAQEKDMGETAPQADAAHADDFQPAPPVPVVEDPAHASELHAEAHAAAQGIEVLKNQALSSNEVAQQLEDLTGVVLNSAEVSTRSASVAADVSLDMRKVMAQITADHKTNVMQSRVLLGGMLLFLLVGLGTFFAISTRMQQNIHQLDAMSLALGKRVVELDATVSAFTNTSRALAELSEKLDGLEGQQEKMDHKFEEVNKLLTSTSNKTAEQSSQSLKALDEKLQNLNKQLQTLETKVQAVANRPIPAPAPAPNNQQAVIAEIQKLKKDLEAANAKAARERAAEAKAAAPARLPEPKPAPARVPEAKAVEPKAAAPKAAEPKPAEVKQPEPKAAEAVPAAPPKPAVRDNRVFYPRPNDSN